MQLFFRDENIEMKKEGKKALNNLKKMTHWMGGKGLKQSKVANEAHSVSLRKFNTGLESTDMSQPPYRQR